MAEFAYNNKVHTRTKVLSFKANNGQNPRMGFKLREKGKYKGVERLMERTKEAQERPRQYLLGCRRI